MRNNVFLARIAGMPLAIKQTRQHTKSLVAKKESRVISTIISKKKWSLM